MSKVKYKNVKIDPVKFQSDLLRGLKDDIHDMDYNKFKVHYERIKNKIENAQGDKISIEEYLDGRHDEGRSLLHWAALWFENKDLIEYLINEGANVDHQDGRLRTPISNAVDNGHIGNVRALLTNRADPTIPDWTGDTCLHVAAHNDSDEVIEVLLADGRDTIDKVNKNGATPVHIAAKYSLHALHAFFHYKSDDAIRLLNVGDNYGDTPLHYAATAGDSGDAATYLMLLGADRIKNNKDGVTPIQAAREWGDEEMVDIILNFSQDRVLEDIDREEGESPAEAYYKHVKSIADEEAAAYERIKADLESEAFLELAGEAVFGHEDDS